MTDEELYQLQIDILTRKLSDNPNMVFKANVITNKGLNPEFFTGQQTRIVNALNTLASSAYIAVDAAEAALNRVNTYVIDMAQMDTETKWENLKVLMGKPNIVEGLIDLFIERERFVTELEEIITQLQLKDEEHDRLISEGGTGGSIPTDVAERLQAAEDKLLGLESGTVQDSINKSEEEAKQYVDEKITQLAELDPEMVQRLEDLMEVINQNQDIFDGYLEQQREDLENLREELLAEINSQMSMETTLRQLADETLTNSVNALQDSVDDITDPDSGILTQAKDYTDEQTVALQSSLDLLNSRLENAETKNTKQDTRLGTLETKLGREATGSTSATGVYAKINNVSSDLSNTKNMIYQVQAEVDAAEIRIEALESGGGKIAEIEESVAANKLAIDVLNGTGKGSVSKAIEDALNTFSNTEETRALLNSVISSLVLTIEEDQVLLKLGGVEGVTITSVSLDLATYDDIDAIIAGLDDIAE